MNDDLSPEALVLLETNLEEFATSPIVAISTEELRRLVAEVRRRRWAEYTAEVAQ